LERSASMTKKWGCIPRANSTVTVPPHDVIDFEGVLLTELLGGLLNRLQFFHSACNFDFCHMKWLFNSLNPCDDARGIGWIRVQRNGRHGPVV
jgi:hypothetical protein